jgi:hypothetical protein
VWIFFLSAFKIFLFLLVISHLTMTYLHVAFFILVLYMD